MGYGNSTQLPHPTCCLLARQCKDCSCLSSHHWKRLGTSSLDGSQERAVILSCHTQQLSLYSRSLTLKQVPVAALIQVRVDSVPVTEAGFSDCTVGSSVCAIECLKAGLSWNSIHSVTSGHIEVHVHTSFPFLNFRRPQVWNFTRH